MIEIFLNVDVYLLATLSSSGKVLALELVSACVEQVRPWLSETD
jgi:hypothetical protein